MKRLILAVAMVAVAMPASAQIGAIRRGLEAKKQIEGLRVTDEEAREIGAAVSERIRERYGVVQDQAVHQYVTLVGTVVAQAVGEAPQPYTFIVLDTDAVNAFAAPGGFVHITRGALGLIDNEAELAGVLGHEIGHIAEKHTVKAIEKSNRIQMTSETLAGDRALLEQVANLTYEHIVENSFDRADEMESDKVGVAAVNTVGYAPSGLSTFLQRLADRNKDASEKRGLFASHPDIEARIKRIDRQIKDDRLSARATVEARYRQYISYEATAQADIAMVEEGAAGLAGGSGEPAKAEEEKKKEEEEPKRRGFGLSSLVKPGGPEKQSAQVMASGGARGVDPERDAKGGPNPSTVTVRVTAAEIAEFKKGIGA